MDVYLSDVIIFGMMAMVCVPVSSFLCWVLYSKNKNGSLYEKGGNRVNED